MFHSNTERLIDYWRTRRGENPFPTRTEIDPGAFTDLLPQTFILGREAPGRYPFRLSGGFVANLHGRELKGEQALPLWVASDRARIQSALELCRASADPIVINAQVIASEMEPFAMEIMAAPVANPEGDVDRYLGLYQPTGALGWLQEGVHRLLSVDNVLSTASESELEPRLRLAVINGRQIA
jgi:hypothetical protein